MSSHHFGNKPYLKEDTPLDKIEYRADQRPLDQKAVDALEVSLHKEGLTNPIILSSRLGPESRVLIAGGHRLAAARKCFWKTIPSFVREMTEQEEQLCVISENLARAELSKLERAEQIAAWFRLTGKTITKDAPILPPDTPADVVAQFEPTQLVPVPSIRAAAKEIGVNREAVRRSVKIDDITPEAKKTAHDVGLHNNQAALLEIASYADEDQVQAVKDISERIRKAKEASRPAKSPSTTASAAVPSTTASASKSPAVPSASGLKEWSREVAERLITKAGKHGGLGCCFGGSEKYITLPKEVWIKHAKAILAAAEAMPDAPAETATDLTEQEQASVAACL
jgi:ParB family transcriptional regulator, chromosome partitioning protein